MSLKINYLDKKKSSHKNKAIFVHSNIKTSSFKGEFDLKTNQKIENLIKLNKSIKESKIFSLNYEFDQKIIVIFILKANTDLEFEKLGGKFFDYLKKNDITDIYISSHSLVSSKHFGSFIHGIELKSYEFIL